MSDDLGLPENVEKALSDVPVQDARAGLWVERLRRAIKAALLRERMDAFEAVSEDTRIPLACRADMDQEANAVRSQADALEAGK